jgi:integrase/recombinase XerD
LGILIEKEVSDSRNKNGSNQAMVPIWFRVPKIWDDFLNEKAQKEYCSKSDLLRRAFNFAYDSELKEFRVQCQRETNHDSLVSSKKETMVEGRFTLTLYNIENDPWIESMVAFVANKRSPRTHRVYRAILNQLFAFVAKHPSKVKQSDIIRYRNHLEEQARAPSTIRQRMAAVSGYYTFCISHNLTIYNPVRGVNRPSVDAYSDATWLNKDQAKALLSQPNLDTVRGKRDYAILLMLLLTGLRRSELTNIKRGDIQERGEKLYLTYNCKGGTKVVRDIPKRCWGAIESYLTASGREITGDSPIFIAVTDAGERLRHYYGKNGQNGSHSLSSEAIRQIVTRHARRAFKEEIKVSPHTLRHTAGTLLRKSGRSIEEVQSFMKHRRVDTTRRYLHVVEADDSEFGECIAQMLDL